MLLEVKDIKLSFTNGHNEPFNLLDGVDLRVESGKITALVGGNGTGKTTLFNIISGFEKAYTGDVVFAGNHLNRIPPYKISRMGIGRLFQDGQLWEGLTLMENLKAASEDETCEQPFYPLVRKHKVREMEQGKEVRARQVLSRLFGADCQYLKRLDEEASSFSYGEQRLLSLARLLMGNYRLLLLDEPTSGVNPVLIRTIERIIKDMAEKEGKTIFLIEHDMPFVRKVADTCAFLNDGVISKWGPTAEVLDDPVVRNSYLGL